MKGSFIDSQDKTLLHVKVKSMTHEDLENEQHDLDTGFQASTGFGSRALQETTTFGLTDQESIKEFIARSTIAKETLEIEEKPKEEINRNIELSEEITRDEIIADTDFNLTVDNRLLTQRGRGEIK